MTEYLRVVIEAEDRVGMTLDILRVIYDFQLNIVSMEVHPQVVYVKLACTSPNRWEQLVDALTRVPGVDSVGQVEFLPSERREQQMKAVLNSVSEGIIAVDNKGEVTLINPAAERILQCPESKALGRPVQEVLSPDVPMLKALADGKGYDHEEILINTPRGRSHYITTGRSMQDEKGRITGVVAALKDMSQVRDLVYSITRPSMITFDAIIARSQVMKNMINLARTVAKSDSTVLIRGESGTGKELFARALHMASPRKHKPFVPINCAALPDSLLESELFGYEEGAFTGARKGGKQGLFEFAHQGTVFLDEIGELSPHLQVKLLRVLQDGKVRRIGGKEEFPVNARVVTATNRNLEEMLRQGTFREDLYYRLNVIPLFLPPLRERKEDIPFLVESFISKLNARLGTSVKGISPEATGKLMGYAWPGNVRELANAIERAINLAGNSEVLEPSHLIITSGEMYPYPLAAKDARGKENSPAGNPSQVLSLAEQVAETEAQALKQALAIYKSSRLAGKALGVSHTTVLKKMKRYRLNDLEA